MGFYFYPRGGSAHACRSIASQLGRNGCEVTVVAGSRSDIGEHGAAGDFFAGLDLRPVDFTPALCSDDPLAFDGGPGTAPMHASYEDRPAAEDPVMAALGPEVYEHQVEAWSRELELASADPIDLLYLHHLTPLNEAAARVFPGTPVIGQIHGSELLMLERIAHGTPAGWGAAATWAQRLSDWAASCTRIVVSSPKGLRRASLLLDIDPERFVVVPNGFSRNFAPRAIDRAEHWVKHLIERPQGWARDCQPGSVCYEETDLSALRGTVLLGVGRFTEVKRLPLLIEAFAAARDRFDEPTALVLLGGFPGEWEGEHPLDAIERCGSKDVFLAGWHSHSVLPDFINASDLLVHASVNEQFGQVLVEAMACGLPVVAVDRGGPADIIDHGNTGWLIPPDDLGALAEAMIFAVNEPAARRRAGEAARHEAQRSYGWDAIGTRLAGIVRDSVKRPRRPGAVPTELAGGAPAAGRRTGAESTLLDGSTAHPDS
jgi:glycosyltransferase involved in cell wall biosynthesis